jgi:hypothetical protein
MVAFGLPVIALHGASKYAKMLAQVDAIVLERRRAR